MNHRIMLTTLALAHGLGWSQSEPPAVILTVDIENIVIYQQDTTDVTKFATDPKIVPNRADRTFVPVMWLADIVAVNGKPSKGTWTARGTVLFRSATPAPGMAIADSSSTVYWDWVFDILQEDGTPIGTIMAIGWGGTPPPPGAPTSCLAANMTITGGTGAFLGVRGQGAQCGNTVGPRLASVVEDPANRRINRGREKALHLPSSADGPPRDFQYVQRPGCSPRHRFLARNSSEARPRRRTTHGDRKRPRANEARR